MPTINVQDGIVRWNLNPPPYVSQTAHKLSFLDAVEKASDVLRTNYVTQKESLIVSRSVRALIVSLPQFTARDPECVGKCIKLGIVARRMVLLDDEMKEDRAVLDNGVKKAEILIENVPNQS